jgi:hypothetical protein
MINLKKNDKLIIIIAVAVIVIAGIGIAAYNPPEDNGKITGGVSESKTYDVTWETHTKTVSVDSECYAGKGATYSNEIKIEHENIIKVTVEMTWTDDFTHGILITKGEDTLTAEVTYKGTTDTWESVGNGTKEFIKSINSIPYDTTIEAENEQKAYEKIEEEYSTDDSLIFTIDVDIQPGEKIFRPLKFIRDKGNDFELTITYEYYDASLTEGNIENTGQDNNDSDNPEEIPAYLGMMIQAGFTRW